MEISTRQKYLNSDALRHMLLHMILNPGKNQILQILYTS